MRHLLNSKVSRWVDRRTGGLRRSVTGIDARLRDRGTATAEYAIATLSACGFAGLLMVILRSSEVHNLLFGIIRRALSAV
jgi:Protein of unknown function (DUF4244)